MATNTSANDLRKQRRTNTLIQIGVAALVIILLVYYEQIALLYVLATLSVTVLLSIVAFSNFGEARTETMSAPFDDAAAIADAAALSSSPSPDGSSKRVVVAGSAAPSRRRTPSSARR